MKINNTEQSESAPRFSRLWSISKIILALGLIAFVVSSTNFGELGTLGKHIIWIWIWPYFLLYCLLTIIKSYQYSKLLGAPVSFLRMMNIVVMQNGLSNIVANSAGILSYLVMLREEQRVSISRSAMVFVIAKIGDLFAVWVAMLISSLFLWSRISVLHNTIIILLFIMGMPLFVYLLIVWLRRRFTKKLQKILEIWKLIKLSWVSQAIIGLDALVDEERGTILQMTINAISLSALYFVVTLAWYVVQLRLFSVNLDILPIIFVTTLLQLISIAPITILGGLGVVETSSLYLYTIFGVDPANFAAILIGLRALFYLINLFILLYIPLYAFVEQRSTKK